MRRNPEFPRRALCDSLEQRLLLARPLGVDVSHWDGTIDWPAVKAAGYEFAFIKSSGSDLPSSYTDSQYAANAANSVAAGMIVGVYHFADPTRPSTPQQQANYFLGVAGSKMTTGYLPPVLDLETGQDTMTADQLSDWANAFCNTIYNATGVRPLIYTSSNRASNYYNTSVSQWPLWIAAWPSNPNPQTGTATTGNATHGWPANSWKFWQYSASGVVPGIGSNVDLDVWQGDSTSLQNFRIGAPEVSATVGSSNIVDNSATPINFGSIVQGQTSTQIAFTVTNTGGQILNLSGLSVPGGFTILEGLSSTLLSGQSDTFTVRLDSGIVGSKAGQISFNSNDSDESPFNFAVTGTVTSSVVLAAPTNMGISATPSATGITVSWTDASSGEQSYLVERKTGVGGTWAQIANIAANSSTLLDSGIQAATNYVYRVRVYGGGTVYGPYGSEVQATTYAAVPANVIASDGDFANRVHITWDAATGAVSYQVFRGTSPDPQAAALLAPSSTTGYDDTSATAGNTYYYFVAARDALNRLSAKSEYDSGYRFVDDVAPTVDAADFAYQTAVQSVAITFSEDVSASLDASYLMVSRDGSIDPVGVSSVVWDGNTNTAYFLLQGPLADDNYHAVLDGQFISDVAGNPLAGLPVELDFFYLLADANHDGAVDTIDFNALASSFGTSGKSWTDGDFNYDGTVDTVDLNLLASRFGNTSAADRRRAPAGLPGRLNVFSIDPILDGPADDLLI